eukprot:GABV01002450.1.p1 GENE.GABV01002450.1~~GABV01002450.1.p1  ORF type:complete len:177 (-),score=36.45 GABV01002450.1:121-651(-)
MLSIFGYLCFTIVYKYTVEWWQAPRAPFHKPPSLITVLIQMMLSPGSIEKNGPAHLFEDADSQAALQFVLVVLALIAVPLMLLPKPILLWWRHKNRTPSVHHHVLDENPYGDEGKAPEEEEEEEEEFSFGEEFIHQLIHTIEFVLGTVSHTASYLRLWALSLAHAQLAKVFLNAYS